MHKVILVIILFAALFLRVYQIDSVPPGVYFDEASIGYDAYSIGIRGEDQYGKAFPMYFRSFATYQAPLYIYASVLPIKILGLTPFSVRFISIVSGVLLVLITFLLVKNLNIKRENEIGLIAASVVAISPWAIFFSRGAIEANLGLLLFVSSLVCFFRGMKKKSYIFILIAFLLLGLTNYAYHAYRILSILTIILILIFYFKSFIQKKILILGIILFFVIIIPQLFYTATEGSIRRYQMLEYTSTGYFEQNGSEYKFIPLGQYFFIAKTFLSRYFDYISPKSLFLDSDISMVRGIPDMSVFYSWFLIPFMYGLFIIGKKVDKKNLLFFLALIAVSIIPSAVTRETLYTLRVLPFIWIVGLIISFGMAGLLEEVKSFKLKFVIVLILIMFSLCTFYFHYFVLVKHERKTEHTGLPFQLFMYTTQHRNNHYIVDLTDSVAYKSAVFIYKPDLEDFEKQAGVDLDNYYNDLELKTDYAFENLEFRKVSFENDSFANTIVVGDEQTIPDEVAYANGFEPVVKYKSTDIHSITIYKTNPKLKCIRMPKTEYPERKCTPEIMNGN